MRTKLLVAFLWVGLIGAACNANQPTAAPPTPGPATAGQTTQPPGESRPPQPTDTAQPTVPPEPAATGTAQPQPTEEPQPTEPVPSVSPDPGEITAQDVNPPREPLPEPELESVDDIVEAMSVPGLEELVVVSMLDQLGIGLYRADGTAIRAGTETSDADFYLFEDDAYALAEMLRAQYDGEEWITWTDFHDGLLDFGLEASTEELLRAYVDAYAAAPDTPIARFVQGAQVFLDIEAPIPPLGLWLLFVDGMLPPNGSRTAMASIAGGIAAVPATPARTGQAYPQVKKKRRPAAPDPTAEGTMLAIIWTAGLNLAVEPESAHEGHGSPGTLTTFIATIKPFGNLSPFTGGIVEPCGVPAGLDNVPVKWQYGQVLTKHGTADAASGATTATDTSGNARLRYTPRQEQMADPSRGFVARDVARVTASATKNDLIRRLCGRPPPRSISKLIGGDRSVTSSRTLPIAWHEPRVMRVGLAYHYNVTFPTVLGGEARTPEKGTDFFDGELIEQDDRTWRGVFTGRAIGSGDGRFWTSDRSCVATWDAKQVVEVIGTPKPGTLPGDPALSENGDFVLRFLPVASYRASRRGRNCRPTFREHNGVFYAPFNDARVWDPNLGLALKLPAEPGGNRRYAIRSGDLTGVILTDTHWDVNIEFPKPPP